MAQAHRHQRTLTPILSFPVSGVLRCCSPDSSSRFPLPSAPQSPGIIQRTQPLAAGSPGHGR
eukprot:scaffold23729_cov120-Isochrysis_galbana.AAC.3